MTIPSQLSPGSGLSTPRAKSVRDDTNSNCSNRKALSSTPKTLPTSDASDGEALIQPGPQPMVSRSSTMGLPMSPSSISSESACVVESPSGTTSHAFHPSPMKKG